MLKVVLLVFIIGLTAICFAQQSDAVLAAGINIEKKMSQHFSLNMMQQTGLNENISEVGYVLIDGGCAYHFNRNLSLGLNYRLTELRNLENFYQERQFLYGDISYIKSKGAFSLYVRSRYQIKYYGMSFNADNNYLADKHNIRNKATLRYKLDADNSVFISCEQSLRLDFLNRTDAWRYGLGLSHQFNLYNRIELGYAIYQQVNIKAPNTDYVSSVTYYFKF